MHIKELCVKRSWQISYLTFNIMNGNCMIGKSMNTNELILHTLITSNRKIKVFS